MADICTFAVTKEPKIIFFCKIKKLIPFVLIVKICLFFSADMFIPIFIFDFLWQKIKKIHFKYS